MNLEPLIIDLLMNGFRYYARKPDCIFLISSPTQPAHHPSPRFLFQASFISPLDLTNSIRGSARSGFECRANFNSFYASLPWSLPSTCCSLWFTPPWSLWQVARSAQQEIATTASRWLGRGGTVWRRGTNRQ
jgi:hypothetical protein